MKAGPGMPALHIEDTGMSSIKIWSTKSDDNEGVRRRSSYKVKTRPLALLLVVAAFVMIILGTVYREEERELGAESSRFGVKKTTQQHPRRHY
jgi:hypothetical protein